MNTKSLSHHTTAISEKTPWVEHAVSDACNRISPVWPLDKSIAVNPWWKMRGDAIQAVAARLQWLGNIKMHMDKSYYQGMWATQISSKHLSAACHALKIEFDHALLINYLAIDEQQPTWQHLGELLDQQKNRSTTIPWREEVIHQISQFCALYFQYPERMQDADDTHDGFYKMWLAVVRQDKGIEILMSAKSLSHYFRSLPESITELFSLAATTFNDDIEQADFTDYCHALLLDINGWSSWMANAAWQADFEQKSDNLIEQLLAVRLAWDIVLWQYARDNSGEKFTPVRIAFLHQITSSRKIQHDILKQQRNAWVWHTALEISVQKQISQQISEQLYAQNNGSQAEHDLHAIFCIDVRSEPIRRALELQSQSIKTSGFAGFFGLPLEYTISDSKFSRPQLPGLLKASITAQQVDTVYQKKSDLLIDVANKKSADAAPSTFGIVEAKGLGKIIDLFKRNFAYPTESEGVSSLMSEKSWVLMRNNTPINNDELADIAAGILTAMGITTHFSKRVLLVGHASCTTNNPHSAGLDCGACGGQSGEVNVKVLAQVLNNPEVRTALEKQEIHIPSTTQFVACLHNTTTDEIQCFESGGTLAQESWIHWLSAATYAAQTARAKSVGISHSLSPSHLKKQFDLLSHHWAQLRPEWGLANNAAFIVAPRTLTKEINLEGRSFLHDYQWQTDAGFSILESIITAPMVVTNWINLHYYASVTDNQKYGSGNKLLHNVVGGNVGVFEGNGGDLRIGLPIQSVNDGAQWRHQPVRLNVYIAAPKVAIEEIISRHSHIAELVNNSWLYIFQIDEKDIWGLSNNTWRLADTYDNPSRLAAANDT